MKTIPVIVFITLGLLLFLSSRVIADGGLAKGAVPGELYIYGVGGYYPDCVNWLYRSTDSGQTVYLQSDTVLVNKLAEGVVVGELYKTRYGRLSYSDNYGVDFVLNNILGTDLAAATSGYASGEVYAYIHHTTRYSSDYGETFVDKGTCPALVFSMSVGHSPGEVYYGCYHGEVYHSSNYGETYQLIVDLANSIDIRYISRGSEVGEIYFFGNNNWFYFSPNCGDTLYQQFHFDTDFVTGIAGGFCPGEVFVLESKHYFEGGGDLYIHHSTDYGQTFTSNHVYSTQEDVLPPAVITDLKATLADSSIVLNWSEISQDIWGNPESIDYYVVYRDTVPDYIPTSGDSIGAPVMPTFTDSEASLSTFYFYLLKAVDDSGNKSKVSNGVGKIHKVLVSI
jgi:hypothetical protein